MMINVFYRNRNTIGQFMVALIFLGTFGFLFMFDGFTAKSEAKSCCGGAPAVTTFAADSSSDYGSDVPIDAESTGGCCSGEGKVIPSSSNNSGDGCTCLGGNPCSYCDSPPAGGCGTNSCPGGCGCESDCCTLDCKQAGDPCSGLNEDTGECTSASL